VNERERKAALGMLAAAYRCDRLIELCADLADCVVAHGQGRVGPSPVRHAARLVVQEAEAVVLATVGPDDWEAGQPDGDEEDGDGD
jgi:hypothetical protein